MVEDRDCREGRKIEDQVGDVDVPSCSVSVVVQPGAKDEIGCHEEEDTRFGCQSAFRNAIKFEVMV